MQFANREEVVDELYRRMVQDHEPFWITVYLPYMARDLTNNEVRELVERGLEEANGVYKKVAKLFNLSPGDYKRFMNFLEKHDLKLPFAKYRTPIRAQAPTD